MIKNSAQRTGSATDSRGSMIRICKDKEHPYSMVSNSLIHDETLTWEARGVLVYLLSHPDNWMVKGEHLVAKGPSGRDKMFRILRELEGAGYLHREQFQQANGRWAHTSVVYETPHAPNSTRCGFSEIGESSMLTSTEVLKENGPKKGNGKNRTTGGTAGATSHPERGNKTTGAAHYRQSDAGHDRIPPKMKQRRLYAIGAGDIDAAFNELQEQL